MAIKNYSHTAAERFMRYVQIDTQSDPNSLSCPSTEKQKDLSRVLVKELKAIGIADAELDEHGYVYATIPSTTNKAVPVICLCSHVDVADDCSGTNVKPILHKNWDGSDIVLPDDTSIVISKDNHSYLKEKIGEDIITASGLTLLGADNKAGVSIIMDLAKYLIENPGIKHGKIRILFTPDEEIGRGANKVDIQKLGADFGYTMDDGENFSIESENFSADGMDVIFHGIAAHAGAAKGKMINAVKLAANFIDRLPKDRWSPETTEGKEGYVHPGDITGAMEKAEVKFIIRDFETAKLAEYEQRLKDLANETVAEYPGSRVEFVIKEQYRNMGEIVRNYPQVVQYAKTAYERTGLKPQQRGIRGGTDGARLSFMGLPCPNLFTGQMALHSRQEYISVQDMEKSVAMLVELVQVWEENS